MKVASGFEWGMCLVISFAGCSTKPTVDYGKVTLLSVSGTVTLDGKPLANAVVTFENPDTSFSYGMTNPSGKYSLQFDSVKSGCTPGKKTVRISTKRKILGLNSNEEAGDAEGARGGAEEESTTKVASVVEQVPDRYNKKSELTVEVSSDKTNFVFDLKSK